MNNKKLLIGLGIILLVLILDQSLKIWVKTHMLIGEDSYLHWGWGISWFRLHFVENPGMAFGITLPGKFGKLFLSLFRMVLVIVLFWILVKHSRKFSFGFTLFLSLIIAGALGNLIDSMFYGLIFTESPYFSFGGQPAHFTRIGDGYGGFMMGRVVDMLWFPLCYCHFPEWLPIIGGKDFSFFRPIFNIADSSIFIGTVGIILFKNKFEEN